MQHNFSINTNQNASLPEYDQWLDNQAITEEELDDIFNQELVQIGTKKNLDLPKRIGNEVIVKPNTNVGGFKYQMIDNTTCRQEDKSLIYKGMTTYEIFPGGYISIHNENHELLRTFFYTEGGTQ